MRVQGRVLSALESEVQLHSATSWTDQLEMKERTSHDSYNHIGSPVQLALCSFKNSRHSTLYMKHTITIRFQQHLPYTCIPSLQT
jgi:hypothetical protein